MSFSEVNSHSTSSSSLLGSFFFRLVLLSFLDVIFDYSFFSQSLCTPGFLLRFLLVIATHSQPCSPFLLLLLLPFPPVLVFFSLSYYCIFLFLFLLISFAFYCSLILIVCFHSSSFSWFLSGCPLVCLVLSFSRRTKNNSFCPPCVCIAYASKILSVSRL